MKQYVQRHRNITCMFRGEGRVLGVVAPKVATFYIAEDLK